MPFYSIASDYVQPRHTAIIDVGSNSFRLIVIEYVPEHWFHLVDEIRESVRLAEGMSEDGNLQPAAMDRALDALHVYAAFCHASHITDIRACATAAVRIAKNQQEFLDRVKEETGIEVQVLTGEQEAYFGYLAAINSTTLQNGFIVDLGGASLEISHVENRQIRENVSFNLGAVRVTESFLAKASPPDAKVIQKLYDEIYKTVRKLDWFRASEEVTLVGLGGTLRNLGRIAQEREKYGFEELHGFLLSRKQIETTAEELSGKTVGEIKKIPGMKEDRADLMLGGATVIRALMDASGFEVMEICSQGLREGIFYDRYLYHKKHRRFDDVREATIMNLSNLYPYQQVHAERVAYLSLRLFDQAPPDTMICNLDDRELLRAASILHDIGASIDYNDHHKHSFYLVMSAGLPGFTHRELAMVALLTRYHRKGNPNVESFAKILAKDDDKKLVQMTACLRLAEQLERSRDGVVRDLRVSFDDKIANLELDVEGDGVVALWSVARHADIFEQAFGKKLDITVRHLQTRH